MNQTIVTNFIALIELERKAPKPNVFRIKTYNKVCKLLSEIDFEVTDSNQLDGYHGIGAKTKQKVDEILNTGTLSQLAHSKTITSTPPSASHTDALANKKKLLQVTGIGPVKAKKLIDEDYTLEKLISMYLHDIDSLDTILTHHQILGIKYYQHLNQRIPYNEITKIQHYIHKCLDWINHTYFSPGCYAMIICGSYRRQATDSGDIDILFYNTLSTPEHDSHFFQRFLNRLINLEFLKDHLTDPDRVTTKYMGLCKLKNYDIVRRIDMRCIRKISLGSALLYFTGTGEFNKNMRMAALKKGMTLNEYGIYKLNSDKTKGECLGVNTEEDIFKLFNMDYIEPQNRTSSVKFL